MADQPFLPPLLVTLAQAAELLAVSLRTIQRMVARGELDEVRPTPDTPRIRYRDLIDRVAGGPRSE